MTRHSRLSPGIETNEIDRSDYGKTDYSITGTTVLVCGFADKGEDYTPQWVNTMTTFEQLYGTPTNECELYLQQAAREVIQRGGVCVAAKLPYDNAQKDRFAVTKFRVCGDVISGNNEYIKDLTEVDQSLTACLSVEAISCTGLIDMATLDGYKTGSGSLAAGDIVVVDVSRTNYDAATLISSNGLSTGAVAVECLGVMPVLVAPANAMFYQGLISSVTSCDAHGREMTSRLSAYQPVADATCRDGISRFSMFGSQSFAQDLSAWSVYDDCVSKSAASTFPNVTYSLSATVDRANLKKVGIVVFAVTADKANDNKVCFSPVESFVGSLDRLSRDPQSGASDYIANVVNSSSKYVNVFANVRTDSKYQAAQTLVASNHTVQSLGFMRSERKKTLSYSESVIKPLNVVFDKACDPNQVRIDVVADAGVTNIAAFAARTYGTGLVQENANWYPFLSGGQAWQFDADAVGWVPKWHNVVRKFDDFCKSTRKDCIFVADMFRPLALDGDEKSVRSTNISSTVENTVVRRLKYVSDINSSWSAGYGNWFYSATATGDFFWCPPSIKAAGAYVYTDAYYHPWDAPAGLARGVVRDAYDVAFNPRKDEAGRVYQHAWNFAVNYPLEGVIIEGQKTFQLKPTALDRVNVRRLMIWLEKRVVAVARRFVYEGNTAYMRQRFVDSVRPILEEARAGYGIQDYAVRCDDTLNDEQAIENNELRCIIAVKPVKTIEYIQLSFVITNQSASVTEEVMR